MTGAAGTRANSEVIERLKGEGWEVLVPGDSAETVPATLLAFAPDLVARRGAENLLVQIFRHSELSSTQLRQLAEAVNREPGWSLEVVAVPDDIHLADLADLAEKLNVSQRTLEDHPDVALIVGWAAVEGLLRRLARTSGIADVRDFASLLEDLAYMGPIGDQEHRLLLTLRTARNSVAHGMKAAPVEPEQVRKLLRLGEDLLIRLGAEPQTV